MYYITFIILFFNDYFLTKRKSLSISFIQLYPKENFTSLPVYLSKRGKCYLCRAQKESKKKKKYTKLLVSLVE